MGSTCRDIVARVLQPHRLNNPDRVRMFGPEGPAFAAATVVLSMILHEMATNAAKYGALSNDSGTVTLDWEVVDESDGRKLRMIWTESGGPHVTAPVQRGFGSRLIERSAWRSARRRSHRRLLSPRGVVCTVTCAFSTGELIQTGSASTAGMPLTTHRRDSCALRRSARGGRSR